MNLEDLFFDDVKIVDEPFGGRRDRSFVADILSDAAVGSAKSAVVALDPREDGPSFEPLARDLLRLRETGGVLFQSF